MNTGAHGHHEAFRPAWWLAHRHLQTLWPTLFRRAVALPLRRERLELEDGDFLDLAWTQSAPGPLVIVLHGLEGSARSKYAVGLLRALRAAGFEAVVMQFRGCSGEPNRLARSYHSGDTADFETVRSVLAARQPGRPLAAVGFSLGGNVLLKWAGERGPDGGLAAAVAVSVPFDLARAADALNAGFPRLYQWWLVRSLLAGVRGKFAGRDCPVDLTDLDDRSSFWRFDDRVTAPLHGFRDVHHYYATSSSRPYLADIRIPTLLLQAADDPFLPPDALPRAEGLPATVRLELSPHGGHVGFVGARRGLRPHYWLESRIPRFLAATLNWTGAAAN